MTQKNKSTTKKPTKIPTKKPTKIPTKIPLTIDKLALDEAMYMQLNLLHVTIKNVHKYMLRKDKAKDELERIKGVLYFRAKDELIQEHGKATENMVTAYIVQHEDYVTALDTLRIVEKKLKKYQGDMMLLEARKMIIESTIKLYQLEYFS